MVCDVMWCGVARFGLPWRNVMQCVYLCTLCIYRAGVYVYTHAVYVCMHVRIFVCVVACICLCTRTCMHVRICVCMHFCLCVHDMLWGWCGVACRGAM